MTNVMRYEVETGVRFRDGGACRSWTAKVTYLDGTTRNIEICYAAPVGVGDLSPKVTELDNGVVVLQLLDPHGNVLAESTLSPLQPKTNGNSTATYPTD